MMRQAIHFFIAVLLVCGLPSLSVAQTCTPITFSTDGVYQRSALLKTTLLEGIDEQLYALERSAFTNAWNRPLETFIESKRILSIPNLPEGKASTPLSAAQAELVASLQKKYALPSEWYAALADFEPTQRWLYAARSSLAMATNIDADTIQQERMQAILYLEALLKDSSEHAASAQEAVTASYWLGRIYQQQHAFAIAEQQLLEAQYLLQRSNEYFTLSRAYAAAGFPDTEGYARKSYADQTRLLLKQHLQAACDVSALTCTPNMPIETLFQALELAILSQQPDLYHFLFLHILNEPLILQKALQNDRLRDYLIIYTAFYTQQHQDWSYHAGSDPHTRVGSHLLAQQFITFFPKNISVPSHPLAFYISHIAYQAHEFTLAEQWLAEIKTPASHWLRAKMAFQAGDLENTGHILQSIRTHEVGQLPQGLSTAQTSRIAAEQAIIALAQKEFLRSLSLFLDAEKLLEPQQFPACLQTHADSSLAETPLITSSSHWWTIAYLAEQVLTLEELELFVQQQVNTIETFQLHPVFPRLRYLLARRQMRASQWDRAIQTFTPPPNYGAILAPEYQSTYQQHLELAQIAVRVHQLHQRAESAWSTIGQAQALFQAAQLLAQDRFTDGMRSFAYELGPDFLIFQGQYAVTPPSVDRQDLTLVSPAEQARLESTQHPYRFHYRYRIAEMAAQAAQALPSESQAYAAVLCHAYRWTKNEPKVARQYYEQYIKHGPLVTWSFDAHQACPLPDFPAARRLALQQSLARKKQPLQRLLEELKGWL